MRVTILADSPTKTSAGTYSRYTGTIKVTLGAAVSQFDATSSGQQNAYPYGSFTGVFAQLTITPGSNFSGNPTVTYANTGNGTTKTVPVGDLTYSVQLVPCWILE